MPNYNVVITNSYGVNELGAAGNDFITGAQGSCLTVWVTAPNGAGGRTAFAHVLSANLVRLNQPAAIDRTILRLGNFWTNILANWNDINVSLIRTPLTADSPASTGYALTAIRNALLNHGINEDHIHNEVTDSPQYVTDINGVRTALVDNGWALTRQACGGNVNGAIFVGGVNGVTVLTNDPLEVPNGAINNIQINDVVP